MYPNERMARKKQSATMVVVLVLVGIFLLNSVGSFNSFTVARNTNVGLFVIEDSSGSPFAIGISPANPEVGDEVTFTLVLEIANQFSLCEQGVSTTSAEFLVRRNGNEVTSFAIPELQGLTLCQSVANVDVTFNPSLEGNYDVSLQIFGTNGGIVTQDFETFTVSDSVDPVDCSDVNVPECGEAQWETLNVNGCIAEQRRICQEVVEINNECVLRSKDPETRSVPVEGCSDEVCNGLDDDGDSLVDENPSTLCTANDMCLGSDGCVDRSTICEADGGTKVCTGGNGFDIKNLLLIGGIALIGFGLVGRSKKK